MRRHGASVLRFTRLPLTPIGNESLVLPMEYPPAAGAVGACGVRLLTVAGVVALLRRQYLGTQLIDPIEILFPNGCRSLFSAFHGELPIAEAV